MDELSVEKIELPDAIYKYWDDMKIDSPSKNLFLTTGF